jgi:ABC-2 type transport system permease protein
MSAMHGFLYNPHFAPGRVFAMVLRHYYLLRGSLPRIVELGYWPTVQMLLWGFITQFFATNSSYVAQSFGVLLSAVLLWDILFRGQIGLSIAFFEEMWSRNLGHLFVSPLRAGELIAALLSVSLMRTVLGLLPASLFAMLFFGFSVYSMGLALVAFFFNLIVLGWAVGLTVSGMVVRMGLGAESLAWAVIFALAPLSGIYYPVTTLPAWLQPIAWCLPSAYVFEGMRTLLVTQRFDAGLMLQAALINLVYLGLGIAAFLAFIHSARKRALLLQIGE